MADGLRPTSESQVSFERLFHTFPIIGTGDLGTERVTGSGQAASLASLVGDKPEMEEDR